MEMLGNIHDITMRKEDFQGGKKIKIRTVLGEKDIIIDKIELLVDKQGRIKIQ